uniref:Membrane dipeptidase n=1 Tax=candidate division WOR-3 bacterium TaxID=2052148 RepID=A0A7C6EKF8_UNCW3
MNIPVFDLHCDTPMNIKKRKFNHIKLTHLKPSVFAGAIFAHFVYPKEKEPFDAGLRLVLSTINYLKEKEEINILYELNKIDDSKTNIILGVEGGHIFDKGFTQFETFYELGVRVYTLTWNNSNRFAHSAFDDDKKGLTKKGREFIRSIKNYDVIIDLSHSSTKTVLDVCEICENRVIASHSCIRKLNPFIRNIDDSGIRAIAEKDGVVGINFSKKHLGKYNVNDHINYLYEYIGIKGISIGSDFDGITDPVLKCPEGYKKIADRLRRDDYKEKEIEKILYRNFLRVLKKI